MYLDHVFVKIKEIKQKKTWTWKQLQYRFLPLCKGRSHRFANGWPMVQFLAISKIELKILNVLQTKEQKEQKVDL